ncbi:hypothetical protein [Campylobacter phage CJLB-7]|nr:hypothetical protein [Campylobacter phage CJLB-7]
MTNIPKQNKFAYTEDKPKYIDINGTTNYILPGFEYPSDVAVKFPQFFGGKDNVFYPDLQVTLTPDSLTFEDGKKSQAITYTATDGSSITSAVVTVEPSDLATWNEGDKTFTGNEEGSGKAIFELTDDKGRTAMKELPLTVTKATVVTTLTLSPDNLTFANASAPMQEVTVTTNASDFTLEFNSQNIQAVKSGNKIQVTPKASKTGSFTITVKAQADGGNQISKTLNVTVNTMGG